MPRQQGQKLIADNVVRHDYVPDVEAGIVLSGTEVKALREGQVQLGQAFATRFRTASSGSSVPRSRSGWGQPAEPRPRSRPTVSSIGGDRLALREVREKGLTLVPTRLYFKDGRVKVELALARGRRRTNGARSRSGTRNGRWSGAQGSSLSLDSDHHVVPWSPR